MSYSGDPSDSPLDSVRFLVGDTTSPEQFTDLEIDFVLAQNADNIYGSAAFLCEKITTLITGGGLASKSIGGLSESYSQGSIQFFTDLAKSYRMRATRKGVPVYEDESQIFSMRQFDMPGVSDPAIRKRTSRDVL